MFRYNLKQAVKINISGEVGEIKGRAEYINNLNDYLVIYRASDGRAAEAWFDESEISSADEE
ncbi:hypothetical protein QPK14_20160 [Photorhabdus temperata subsp. temperata]|uniref:Uncharacterized protein n=2 Tax=Photorhabdus TaxID=29487 RepID=A0A7X5QH91_9GAMM|nr:MULTISPECIES: hypothetical protein [Photorhabdus]KER03384.1 hypothetical protein MEG1DRAFT_01859 [Photorhabdus temperata subsp. temperata Meg1]NHB94343.1 hypothetical protein [Photorhabdus cinerea]